MFCSWDCLVDRHLLLCRISFTVHWQFTLCTALLRTMLNWLLTSPRRGVRNELGCHCAVEKTLLIAQQWTSPISSHPISSHLIPSPYWIVIFHMLHLAMPNVNFTGATCEQFAFVAFEAAVSVIGRFSAWWTWLDSTRKTYSIYPLVI